MTAAESPDAQVTYLIAMPSHRYHTLLTTESIFENHELMTQWSCGCSGHGAEITSGIWFSHCPWPPEDTISSLLLQAKRSWDEDIFCLPLSLTLALNWASPGQSTHSCGELQQKKGIGNIFSRETRKWRKIDTQTGFRIDSGRSWLMHQHYCYCNAGKDEASSDL